MPQSGGKARRQELLRPARLSWRLQTPGPKALLPGLCVRVPARAAAVGASREGLLGSSAVWEAAPGAAQPWARGPHLTSFHDAPCPVTSFLNPEMGRVKGCPQWPRPLPSTGRPDLWQTQTHGAVCPAGQQHHQ